MGQSVVVMGLENQGQIQAFGVRVIDGDDVAPRPLRINPSLFDGRPLYLRTIEAPVN